MAKPVILAVDDDPMVLNAVERDLRKKYGQDYRLMKVNSGNAALGTLKELQKRNQTVEIGRASCRERVYVLV